MTLTNFPNGISSFGAPIMPYGMFTGTHFFVKPNSGNDANDGLSPEFALNTLAAALAKATANKNDVVWLIAESNTASATTDYQSTSLDWNKDGVHLIGVNAGPQIGQRSRIAQLSTVVTIETLFKVSADNCLIANIEVFHGVDGSTATTPVAVEVTGQRNVFRNCQFSGMGDSTSTNTMDVSGARSLLLNGASECLFDSCYIGLDTVIKATAAAEVEIKGSSTRNIFDRCIFNTYTSNASMLMLTINANTDRFVIFRDCAFINVQNITSATAMTALMDANSVNGNIHIINPYLSGFTNITAADASRVKVLGLDGTATGHLIGVSQGVDVA